MKIRMIALSALLMASCATSPQPNLINGRYFMIGDRECKRYIVEGASQVGCYNSDGKYTGYRNAMSQMELQYYSAQMAQQQQQVAQMRAQLDAGNARLQQQTQQMLQNSQAYTAPPVMSVSPSNVNTAYCSNLGNVLSCRSPLPDANFTCIQAGNVYHCRPR